MRYFWTNYLIIQNAESGSVLTIVGPTRLELGGLFSDQVLMRELEGGSILKF